MRVVIAIDSFKGSMSSVEAGRAAAEGVWRVCPNAHIDVVPIADGGEGSVEALIEGMGGRYVVASVKNPLGKTINARYGIINEATAVIEISAAAGITLLSEEELNPMEASSYGVGEMINDAIANGCRNFIIGIGGSATNDGGIGMLRALGFRFLDKSGADVPHGAKALALIDKIDDSELSPVLRECTFNIACDVKNPLFGENGCSRIFAPQKGAADEQIADMDKAMEHYARLTKEKYPDSDPDFPGCGAAGGIGFAFMSYLNGELKPGIDLILSAVELENLVKSADLVITGEGRLDSQSVMGKAPVGVAKYAKKYDKTVIAFAGSVTKDASVCNEYGIDAFFPIIRTVCPLSEAMDNTNAKRNMADSVEQVIRIMGRQRIIC